MRRNLIERELDTELRFHLDQEIEERVRAGASREDARIAAERMFGSVAAVADDCRDALPLRWLDALRQDARYAVRSFRRAPAFTATAVLTLALGIGANTAIFSLVDALLLRALPVKDPAHLVSFARVQSTGQRSTHFNYPTVQLFSSAQEIFESVAAYSDGETVNLGSPGAVERAGIAWVSGRFYETLGISPREGRLLTPDDDKAGAPPVAVVSHDYWMRRLGGEDGAIGRTVLVEGTPVVIVGVAPAGFEGANVGESDELAMAVSVLPQIEPERAFMVGPGGRWLRILARPRAELMVDQVRARATVVWKSRVLATLDPRASAASRRLALDSSIDLQPAATGTSTLREDFGRPLLVLMAMVGLVLAIACANVAGLLLARSAARRRELAVRQAIGASRARIVRQLLTESALLAAAGATLGAFAARWVGDALVHLVAGDRTAVALDLSPSWHMLLFTTVIAAATTAVFGILPALRVVKRDESLASAANLASSRASEAQRRVGGGLLVAETAVSIVLLVSAGLFARTFWNLRTANPGFRHDGVLLIDVDANRSGITGEPLRTFNRDLLDEVRRLPGVSSATFSSVSPLLGGGISLSVAVDGKNGAAPEDRRIVEETPVNFVGPGYFHTLETAVLAGREFTEQDTLASPGVAIVNGAFARRYMSGANPVGRYISILGFGTPTAPLEVVGLVQDAVYERLRDGAPPTVYAPYLQLGVGRMSGAGGVTLEVYTSGSLTSLAAAFRSGVEPHLPPRALGLVRTFTAQLESGIVQDRTIAVLAVTFGALALLLTSVGLYGLLAYTVARRTNEIGVRLALGASPSQMLRLVVLDGVKMLVVGAVIGLPLAWVASQLVRTMLFGVAPGDVRVSIGAAVALMATGVLAAYIPARRAARVDPLVALRCD